MVVVQTNILISKAAHCLTMVAHNNCEVRDETQQRRYSWQVYNVRVIIQINESKVYDQSIYPPIQTKQHNPTA